MSNRLLTMIVAATLGITAAAVFARGGGGSGAAGGGHGGGSMSAQHISSEGLKNTNGPSAADRDKGLERAEDRMSAEGLAHEKADDANAKHKAQKAPKQPPAEKD